MVDSGAAATAVADDIHVSANWTGACLSAHTHTHITPTENLFVSLYVTWSGTWQL